MTAERGRVGPRRRSPRSLRGLALGIAGLLAACAPPGTAPQEAPAPPPGAPARVAASCAPDPAAAAADSLSRDGLAALACPIPGRPGDMLLVMTDANISWPEVVETNARRSFEQMILDRPVAPGLAFFDPASDSVDWVVQGIDQPPLGAVVSLSSHDPQTGEPERVYLALALGPADLLGAVRDEGIATGMVARR